MLYDVIIIGSGPAGLSAAIYAQRAKLATLVIEKAPMSGGQILNTYEVDNYPGIPGVGGFDLGSLPLLIEVKNHLIVGIPADIGIVFPVQGDFISDRNSNLFHC